eukprot:TRINITY_DN30954_c0_g1_i1.p1 TRINITY_DN30954_c0_g1~~TRINITY_DN30954_c0_g1_i1.p1  ORF type:complete len:313 (-),score=84.47 TRINITY_DN30954_c0_g1_i1:125-1063(-)
MGADLSTQCGCRGEYETILSLVCAPEDAEGERENELRTSVGQGCSVGDGRPVLQDHVATVATFGFTEGPVAASWQHNWAEETAEDVNFYAPPPPPPPPPAPVIRPEEVATAAVPPPSRSPKPSAAATATPAAAPASSAPPPKVCITTALSDIDAAEVEVYEPIFQSMAVDGRAPLDSLAVKRFLLKNSALTRDEIDTEILKAAEQAGDDFCLALPGFLKLMRDNAINDDETFQQFVNLTNNGEDITCEDCRSGLRTVAEQKLGPRLSDDVFERVLNTVMLDAGVVVKMEQWIAYGRKMARILRLLMLTKATS